MPATRWPRSTRADPPSAAHPEHAPPRTSEQVFCCPVFSDSPECSENTLLILSQLFFSLLSLDWEVQNTHPEAYGRHLVKIFLNGYYLCSGLGSWTFASI